MWRSRRYQPAGRAGDRFALLYDRNLVVPKRDATPAQMAAVEAALAVRRTCPTCRQPPHKPWSLERVSYQPGAVRRYGKKKAGRLLDGETWAQFPSAT